MHMFVAMRNLYGMEFDFMMYKHFTIEEVVLYRQVVLKEVVTI